MLLLLYGVHAAGIRASGAGNKVRVTRLSGVAANGSDCLRPVDILHPRNETVYFHTPLVLAVPYFLTHSGRGLLWSSGDSVLRSQAVAGGIPACHPCPFGDGRVFTREGESAWTTRLTTSRGTCSAQ